MCDKKNIGKVDIQKKPVRKPVGSDDDTVKIHYDDIEEEPVTKPIRKLPQADSASPIFLL